MYSSAFQQAQLAGISEHSLAPTPTPNIKQGLPTPLFSPERGLNNTKRRGQAAYRPARLTLRLIQSPFALRRNATVMAIL